MEALDHGNRELLDRIRVLEQSKTELMEKVKAENNTIFRKYDTTIDDYRQKVKQLKETHTTVQ